ncbi:MAG: hypothetical protein HY907_05775 [Deltaproteobacteria bacterium]|nr:hypothetical protein [Deltaproteobacteria bacterium]
MFGTLGAALLLVASGCPVYVQPTNPNNPPPPVVAAPASLVITNYSAEAVYYIHMSQSSNPSWGPDLLGSSDTLAVGQSFTITGVAPGQWDVAVYDSSGNCKLFMQEWFESNTSYTLDVDSQEWTPPYECPVAH